MCKCFKCILYIGFDLVLKLLFHVLFSTESKMHVQDIPSSASRGHTENTSDFMVDPAYYSNFYQPSLYPYYNNLYNYSSYQMAMSGDSAATSDISGSSGKNGIRGFSTAFAPGQSGNQWQVIQQKCIVY